jgi:hypothetical protein
MDIDIDHHGLEVLAPSDCLTLLARHGLGRVSVSIGALPVIVPVTYRLAGEWIVIMTTPGTKLDAALPNAVVAFEVDDIDEAAGTGWSVMVTGVAEEITGEKELAWLRALDLPSWGGGRGTRFVRIRCREASGQRVTTSRTAGSVGRSSPS